MEIEKISKIEKSILIIVLIIILSLILFISKDYYENYKQKKAIKEINIISDAILNYFRDNNSYPTNKQGIDILFENLNKTNNWDGPYLSSKIKKDPWENNYIYYYPGKINKLSFDIISLGKDRKKGGKKLNKDLNNVVKF